MMTRLRAYTAAKRKKLLMGFLARFHRPIRIIDIGGSADFWKRMGITAADGLDITLLNNHHIDKTNVGYRGEISFISEKIADALELKPKDFEGYDLIFSNSMLEHLASRTKQSELCAVIVRSGLPYFIQVPNKFSLVDPHFPNPLVPFFAAYPRWLQARLLTLSNWQLVPGRGSPLAHAKRQVFFYTPISRRVFRRLLPRGKLQVERHLGIPMSLVMTSPTRRT